MDQVIKRSDKIISQIKELRVLDVIDRLEVGPVKIEKNRFTAPYKVLQNGKEDVAELIYSYEEEVFNPADESHQNLVNMIAAQVAINYGLFCKKIVFNGLFDNVDKKAI